MLHAGLRLPGSREFGLHIDFARRALLFGAHLAPAGLEDLSVRRDRELLHEARAILADRYTDPPTISHLARTVAMNRTKLKAGFKKLFGTTTFGFVRALPMREAFDLLRDGTCNVTEAANRAGYNSPGAFTSVFKAEYGFAPHRTQEL